MGLFELIFEIPGRDFIERTRGDPRADNAQFLRLGEHFFALQAEPF